MFPAAILLQPCYSMQKSSKSVIFQSGKSEKQASEKNWKTIFVLAQEHERKTYNLSLAET